MQRISKAQQFFLLRLHQLADGNPRPFGYNLRNFFLVDLLFQELVLLRLLRPRLFFFQLFLQLRQCAVLQLGQPLQVVAALRFFHLMADILDLLLHRLQLDNALLFRLPLGPHGVVFRPQLRQLLFDVGESAL